MGYVILNPGGIVHLPKDKIKASCNILSHAFQDYPIYTYLFPDDSDRECKSSYIFQYLIHYGLLYGEGHATSLNLEGITVWFSPNYAHETLWRKIKSGAISLFFKLKREESKKLISLDKYLSSLHKRLVPFRHWFLQLIGVDPLAQRRGFGTNLLRYMIKKTAQENLPIYLETQKKANINFYSYQGFKIINESVIPGTEIPNWCMIKE